MNTRVVKITAPAVGDSKDPNDARRDASFKDRVEADIDEASRKKKPDTGWLERFKLTEQEVNALVEPEWIYENLIIRSHLIVIPAAPGAGKTTIMMTVAGEMANSGFNVIYVNADVGGGDVKAMQTMADNMGFHLLLPDMKAGLSMDDVVQKIEDMNQLAADYSEMVFIFDTLKKMTDVINKSRAKGLYKTLRGLTAKGMTIILLAHTNKYADQDGKPIYEGTGDLRSDVDDMIYFIPKKNPDGSLTVSSDPLSASAKRRGNHQPITFNISPERVVTRCAEYVDTAAQLKSDKQRQADESVIESITEAIQAGKIKQVEVIDWCREHHTIGRKTVERVLKRYIGKLWQRQRSFQKNSWNYSLVESTPTGSGTN